MSAMVYVPLLSDKELRNVTVTKARSQGLALFLCCILNQFTFYSMVLAFPFRFYAFHKT